MMSGQMYNGGWVSLEPGQPPTLTDFPSICGDESVPQAVCAGEWEGAKQLPGTPVSVILGCLTHRAA